MQTQIFPFQNSPLAKYAFAAITLEKLYRKFRTMFSNDENEEENEEKAETANNTEGDTETNEIPQDENEDLKNMFFSIDELCEIANPQQTVLSQEVVRIGLLIVISFLIWRYFI